MTRSVTDTIDRALADWDTSRDAMRWQPDPPTTTSQVRIRPPGGLSWRLGDGHAVMAALAAIAAEYEHGMRRIVIILAEADTPTPTPLRIDRHAYHRRTKARARRRRR